MRGDEVRTIKLILGKNDGYRTAGHVWITGSLDFPGSLYVEVVENGERNGTAFVHVSPVQARRLAAALLRAIKAVKP
jgi:hypothetical protein